jgi:hypothetical protein
MHPLRSTPQASQALGITVSDTFAVISPSFVSAMVVGVVQPRAVVSKRRLAGMAGAIVETRANRPNRDAH